MAILRAERGGASVVEQLRIIIVAALTTIAPLLTRVHRILAPAAGGGAGIIASRRGIAAALTRFRIRARARRGGGGGRGGRKEGMQEIGARAPGPTFAATERRRQAARRARDA